MTRYLYSENPSYRDWTTTRNTLLIWHPLRVEFWCGIEHTKERKKKKTATRPTCPAFMLEFSLYICTIMTALHTYIYIYIYCTTKSSVWCSTRECDIHRKCTSVKWYMRFHHVTLRAKRNLIIALPLVRHIWTRRKNVYDARKARSREKIRYTL